MATLNVAMVSTRRNVWEGEASLVVLRTLDGEVGIMPGHSPLMGMLADGPILIRPVEGEDLRAYIHEGFCTVDGNRVIVLAEWLELATEIDVRQAEQELEEARKQGTESEVRKQEGRLQVAVGPRH
ncbi:MAG: F0F1 ATP synthase subunit epsilon [Candidatus Nanopelagicales bacterium]|jgi:F-type H+-transporting ATPase subunit epsilon|nr:F0F1 ATP synthase subunit epsilon [Candidatus Nanopelagicales bacterium]MCU0299893.1 F0F1 ATP synthase subunit epsilon [Candidatus Nanopelagicales bacterium]